MGCAGLSPGSCYYTYLGWRCADFSRVRYFTDIDECAQETHNCDDSRRATCSNNAGSFDCNCNSGYSGNGETCISKLTYNSTHLYFFNSHFFYQTSMNVLMVVITVTQMLHVAIESEVGRVLVTVGLLVMESGVMVWVSFIFNVSNVDPI